MNVVDRRAPVAQSNGGHGGLREVVVCSLEDWDQVWRRNQFIADALLTRSPSLRMLFVEPPVDVAFELTKGRLPRRPGLRALRADGRLQALRPLKPLPRRLGPFSDRALLLSVRRAARRLGFTAPTLWLNDVTYVPLMAATGWPTVYDVTDDWLLAPLSSRELNRLRTLDAEALAQADQVVVCSPALAASRGQARSVTVIPNAIDLGHFRAARPRPVDLPASPTAVYVGTLHESRLDVELVGELARALPALTVTLVGPDALEGPARRTLLVEPNVRILGERPYDAVPAYLQHADLVVVPHVVTPFTESLDPIKAYECLAIDTPTVSTPVAGFRELAEWMTIAPRTSFVDAVSRVLADATGENRGRPVSPAWTDRAREFEHVLVAAASRTASGR